jgi:RNA polymerase sigma factor (sigma-70 family)
VRHKLSLWQLDEKRDFIVQFQNHPQPNEEQTRELVLRWQKDQDESAIETLIRGHFGLTISIAKKLIGPGLSYADLIQEGNIAMIKAAKTFDPARGKKFTSWAYGLIYQAIVEMIAEQGSAVSAKAEFCRLSRKALKIREKLTKELGRLPRPSEIKDRFGEKFPQIKISQKRLNKWLKGVPRCVSLDGYISEWDSRRRGPITVIQIRSPVDARLIGQEELALLEQKLKSFISHGFSKAWIVETLDRIEVMSTYFEE